MMHEPKKSVYNISLLKNKHKSSFTGKSCSWCGRAMEMYYTPWCAVCDKPKLKKGKLNLIQVKAHLKATQENFNSDYIWSTLYDTFGFRNDSGFVYTFGEDGLEEFDMLLKKVFNVKKDFTFWVSW